MKHLSDNLRPCRKKEEATAAFDGIAAKVRALFPSVANIVVVGVRRSSRCQLNPPRLDGEGAVATTDNATFNRLVS